MEHKLKKYDYKLNKLRKELFDDIIHANLVGEINIDENIIIIYKYRNEFNVISDIDKKNFKSYGEFYNYMKTIINNKNVSIKIYTFYDGKKKTFYEGEFNLKLLKSFNVDEIVDCIRKIVSKFIE